VSTPSVAIPADMAGMAGPQRSWAIASVLAAMVLVVLDAAIANIALPTIGQSLHIAPALAVRVVTAYQLGLVMMLLPAAALGERLGFRRVFIAGAVLFTGASALCALSPSLNWLIAARFVQGLGGAAIMALGVALLRVIVTTERLGVAIGWNAMAVALSSAAGPTLGATILSVASWPWLFAVNLPIGAAVLVASRSLPAVKGTGERVDLVSIVLNAAGFALFLIAAEWATSRPAWTLVLFAMAALCAIALIQREAGHSAPLIPLDLLARPSFRVSVLASMLCFAGQAAGLVALPFYLQHAFDLTPVMVGLCLTPWPLTVAFMGPLAGKWANRVSTRWLCLGGGTFMATGMACAALWPMHGWQPALGLCSMLCGVGFGLFNVPNNRAMFLSAPSQRSGAAGGLQGVARLSGQTTGAVMMGVLFDLLPLDGAPRMGLAGGAALALAAGVTSLLHPKAPATVSQ
jgi:DHA2 family multidrug resistance protein-like MFS transporter